MPDDRDRVPVDGELLAQRVAERRHARRVVRAVDEQERVTAQHLEATRHADRGEAPRRRRRASSGVAEEGLGRGQRAGAFAPWWAPCSGTSTSS